MAFSTCTRLPKICTPVDVSRARPRSYARVGVCASMGQEQGPALNRRAAVLAGLSPLLLGASPAWSAFPELDDQRGTRAKETLDTEDQAMDDQLDERRRFAFESLGRMTTAEHKERAKDSYGRLQRDVKQYLDKKLLNRVSNELNLQMASLRYDLEQIDKSKDKAGRKAGRKESKDALQALERLDTYARLNKQNEANQAYSDALSKLGNLVKAYG